MSEKRTDFILASPTSDRVLLDALFKWSHIGVTFLDLDLRFIRINQVLADMNGLPIEAHIGRTVQEIVPALADTVRQVTDRILETGQPVEDHEFSGETLAEPGVKRYWKESWFPVRDEAEQIVGFGALVEEITRRKLAEQNLLEAQRFTDRVLNTSPNVVYLFDLVENRTVYINDAVRSALNFSREEVEQGGNQFMSQRMHPDDLPRMQSYLQRVSALADGQMLSIEYRMQHRDGRYLWFVSRDTVFSRTPQGQAKQVLGVASEITERKAAEESLKKSHDKLQFVLNGMTDGLLSLDRDWIFTYFSEQGAQILGLKVSDLLGKCVWDLFPHAQGSEFHRAYHEAVRSGRPVHFEEYYPAPLEMWLECHAYPSEEGLSVYFRNITERKKSREQLQRNHDTFYTMIQNNPFGVYVIDADFVLRQISMGARKVFSTIDQPVGRDFAEIIRHLWSEPFASQAIAIFRKTLETGEPYVAPSTIERRQDSDQVEAYDWRTERIVLPDGRYGVVCYFYDLSERQHWENRLRESTERLRLATDAAELGIWSWTPALDAVVWENQRPHEIFGLSPDEPPLTAQRFVSEFLHPDDLGIFNTAVEKTLSHGAMFLFQGRIIRVDGQIRWIESTGKPVDVEPGKPMRIVGTVQDITPRKDAEQSLQRLAADLSAADRKKDEFLATLAHELRNPLAAVSGAIELMNRANNDADLIHDCRDTLDRQTRQMVRLIGDLLDVSRISTNKMVLKRQHVLFTTVVRDALEACKPLLDHRGHRLQTHVPDQPIYLDADPVRLAQVLGNLLNNACKYTDPGGQITLHAERDAQNLIIRIRDTGVGIPKEKLHHVFDLFMQVDAGHDRSEGGLGIGLSLVKRLVNLHGGTVDVHSDGPGKGSEFTLVLPIIINAPDDVAPVPSDDTVAATKKILIVDDNRDSARSLSLLLKHAGHQTYTAHDGLEAVKQAESSHPDIILLDIGLPGQSGHEVCKAIRQQSWGRSIHIIALTGWGQEDDRRQSQEAGFDEHLVKPVDFDALLSRIAGICTPAKV